MIIMIIITRLLRRKGNIKCVKREESIVNINTEPLLYLLQYLPLDPMNRKCVEANIYVNSCTTACFVEVVIKKKRERGFKYCVVNARKCSLRDCQTEKFLPTKPLISLTHTLLIEVGKDGRNSEYSFEVNQIVKIALFACWTILTTNMHTLCNHSREK